MSEANPFEEFVKEYRDDPVKFVVEVLGAKPLPYQAEFLQAIADGERKMSVRSGHGTGKSTSASWAMLWYVLLRFPNKVVVTAPTSGQLFDALFAELKNIPCRDARSIGGCSLGKRVAGGGRGVWCA